ncbi:DUF2975 domain-containing protein [Cytophagales bacterium LB-30]|uniref:DUF2975 domain-containing protein n=1 Tax=Shiella aurantiaca TaxID=3058365 RepID=A0ABT8F452_9BACT|nr:DUF2975 domain-containing protein [Shiella aurantiaca]MDN4164996.1 DUF2975 domain-containing protein [Shiella aurantiaca]
MAHKNTFVFIGLQIIAWIIFVGLSIEAGGLLVNFAFSIFKPEFVPNLYQKLDLSALYQSSLWVFYSMYSFVLMIAVLKALLFYKLIQLLMKLDTAKPFSSLAARQITRISYFIFSIGILSYIARQSAKNIMHHGYELSVLNPFWEDSQAYILMAAVVYAIATIFSRGVEIQNENDLTV